MMHMTFYWSYKVTLLIDSWRTHSWTGYALSLLACLLVSAFYQYLENRRIRLKLILSGRPSQTPQIRIPLLQTNLVGDKTRLGVKLAGAILFGVNSAIGYLLMLAIMSFNGGVFIAIAVGLSIGYFFFRSEGEDVSLVVDNSCACT
ncbi:copper transporter 5.1 [Neltuma alba]|uniref:copper transporter 5.1 n=1 Tax=Neltuma alba TaxID=207710 RepID=UPI0010A49623|nr:copper transporter 5.1-like [Prosopis alba]